MHSERTFQQYVNIKKPQQMIKQPSFHTWQEYRCPKKGESEKKGFLNMKTGNNYFQSKLFKNIKSHVSGRRDTICKDTLIIQYQNNTNNNNTLLMLSYKN